MNRKARHNCVERKYALSGNYRLGRAGLVVCAGVRGGRELSRAWLGSSLRLHAGHRRHPAALCT